MAKKMTNNEKAGIIAMVGGVLMLVAGVTGAAAWENIGELAQGIVGNDSLNLVFQVLVILGGLGGLIVILGGLLFRKKDKVKFGKALITIGAGFGLIGFVIFIILALMGEEMVTTLVGAMGIGFIGLVLSIAARMKVRA